MRMGCLPDVGQWGSCLRCQRAAAVKVKVAPPTQTCRCPSMPGGSLSGRCTPSKWTGALLPRTIVLNFSSAVVVLLLHSLYQLQGCNCNMSCRTCHVQSKKCNVKYISKLNVCKFAIWEVRLAKCVFVQCEMGLLQHSLHPERWKLPGNLCNLARAMCHRMPL